MRSASRCCDFYGDQADTFRPGSPTASEYEGALTRLPGAQTIALASLSDSETAALVTELLGCTPLVHRGWPDDRRSVAAGNPFFAEDIVREWAGRGGARGQRGDISVAEATEVNVPATLQATIAARIDRLDRKQNAR